MPWFRPQKCVRVFDGGWNAEAAAYQPAAIAGTWPQMESLLADTIPSLTHALIVLARPADLLQTKNSLLSAEQRQRLWRAFRVPIFEQIIGDHGVVLAAECEAHSGLHIESATRKLRGLSTDKTPCGCGRTSPRIMHREQIEYGRAAAASVR